MKFRKAAISLLLSPLFIAFTVSAQRSDSIKENTWKKIFADRLPEKKNYLSGKSLLVPTAMIGYGFGSLTNGQLQKWNKNIREEVVEDCAGFHTRVDDYLKYAPAATVYLLNFAGIKGRHKIIDRTIILTVSNTLTNQLVTALKHGTHQLRPDGSAFNSFPSGHTATAFVGAEFMNQEFGWKSPWYSVAGYSMASGTALLRILNNRHWFSDVMAGAGIAMLTTRATYWIYAKLENRKTTKQLLFY